MISRDQHLAVNPPVSQQAYLLIQSLDLALRLFLGFLQLAPEFDNFSL